MVVKRKRRNGRRTMQKKLDQENINSEKNELEKVEVPPPEIQDETSESVFSKLKKVPDKKEISEDDEDLVFLKTLLPYLKGMSTVQKLLLRAEIQAVVMKSQSKKIQNLDEEESSKKAPSI